jgi:hypothetical protein
MPYIVIFVIFCAIWGFIDDCNEQKEKKAAIEREQIAHKIELQEQQKAREEIEKKANTIREQSSGLFGKDKSYIDRELKENGYLFDNLFSNPNRFGAYKKAGGRWYNDIHKVSFYAFFNLGLSTKIIISDNFYGFGLDQNKINILTKFATGNKNKDYETYIAKYTDGSILNVVLTSKFYKDE